VILSSEIQKSGNPLVPGLDCIADESEPPNPSQQFSWWFRSRGITMGMGIRSAMK